MEHTCPGVQNYLSGGRPRRGGDSLNRSLTDHLSRPLYGHQASVKSPSDGWHFGDGIQDSWRRHPVPDHRSKISTCQEYQPTDKTISLSDG